MYQGELEGERLWATLKVSERVLQRSLKNNSMDRTGIQDNYVVTHLDHAFGLEALVRHTVYERLRLLGASAQDALRIFVIL